MELLSELEAVEATEYAEDIAQAPSTDLRTLDGQLAILGGIMREILIAPAGRAEPEQVARVSLVLHNIHSVRFAIHDHLGHERLRRLDQIERGLAGLRNVTDQDELLERACRSAAEAGGFTRVMLSRIEDGTWYPWRSWAATLGPAERTFREWMRTEPSIDLSLMLLESELVRRGEPAIVRRSTDDPRVYEPLVRASGLLAYVVAPILSGDRVIGLLHADNSGGEVTDLDRDVLWLFATGFAQLFERAVLLERLRRQRAQVLDALRGIESALDEVATSTVDLVMRKGPAAVAGHQSARPALGLEPPPALEALLTSRELEVLGLMATGATNERIAQQLVIAIGTVKSHVKQILRKLRVENRAEAISQYLRLTIGARED